jgi:hypothetical protein
MARTHARIFVAIWSDEDFRQLPVQAQHMFFTALSQPRMSLCGVMDYLPNRLAKLASGATPRSVINAVKRLEDARFVCTDDETGELLIRSFVRHDGLLSQPNVTKSMAKDYNTVLSDSLKAAIDTELARSYAEEPDLAGWKALEKSYPDLSAKASRKGSANG